MSLFHRLRLLLPFFSLFPPGGVCRVCGWRRRGREAAVRRHDSSGRNGWAGRLGHGGGGPHGPQGAQDKDQDPSACKGDEERKKMKKTPLFFFFAVLYYVILVATGVYILRSIYIVLGVKALFLYTF